VRPRDREIAAQISDAFERYEAKRRPLAGISDPAAREVLIEQMLASVHRVLYARTLNTRKLSPRRGDPEDSLFDPLKAAVLALSDGHSDEAAWLVFLSTHFGKHGRGGWRYLRDVYGCLGTGERWDWTRTSSQCQEFRAWLQAHQTTIRGNGVPGGFGNHRKYESLDGVSSTGTGAVVESYVKWVLGAGNHALLFERAIASACGDGRIAFDRLYHDMAENVMRFGRLARFDYLAMIGKLGIANIEPGSTFLKGATGPLRGARLLFGAEKQAEGRLDSWLSELDLELGVGMQVLEDSLCNWQKSPQSYEPFRG
jgi:hypothetical protein